MRKRGGGSEWAKGSSTLKWGGLRSLSLLAPTQINTALEGGRQGQLSEGKVGSVNGTVHLGGGMSQCLKNQTDGARDMRWGIRGRGKRSALGSRIMEWRTRRGGLYTHEVCDDTRG